MSNTDPAVLPDPESIDIESLQTQAAAAASAQAEAETLRRELAIVRAGVDVSTPAGKFFAENYKGDLAPEAIVEQATAVGAIKAVEETPLPPDNSEAQERLNLGAGETAGAGVEADKDPHDAGFEGFLKARQEGEPVDRAAAHYFSSVLTAAANGDERAIHNPEKWREQAELASA